MAVPTVITDLSTTIASNGPAGSESPASLDDYQRAHAGFIAQLYANSVAAATVIVPSATSTPIGAAISENVDISGTTTITSFDTVAEGINRKGRFTGALTLTHNATSLILPGTANITTAANDRYEARSLGSGNWIVTKYLYASGNAGLGANTFTGRQTLSGASVIDANSSIAAHATTMNPWSLGNYVTATGTAVTFTGMAAAPQAGAEVEMYMNATHTFTDGVVFEVDGNANWTATIGDRVLLRAKSTTVFTVHPRKANGTAVIDVQIQPISASVASSALTISASALNLDFRSATLGSGTVTAVAGTPANLVISSGSTLGAVSAVQSRLAVLALNNAGTIELAVVNISGGNDLSETGVISTTAEGGAGAADSANVIYSTTARTSVAYRVIGYIESTQATAGTWATAPSTIQGNGGAAVVRTALNALGAAPMYTCRAWVSFNGAGTVAIRASGNVSSITDNGTGDYTVNFRTAIVDANYSTVGSGNRLSDIPAAEASTQFGLSNQLTTSVRVCSIDNDTNGYQDSVVMNVAIFR